MGTNSFFPLIDIVILGCGLYILYLYVDMIRSRKLKPSMFFPKGLDLKKCKDVEGFIRHTSKMQLGLGIVTSLCGAVGLFQDYTQMIGPMAYLVLIGIFVVFLLRYSIFMRKAVEKFW